MQTWIYCSIAESLCRLVHAYIVLSSPTRIWRMNWRYWWSTSGYNSDLAKGLAGYRWSIPIRVIVLSRRPYFLMTPRWCTKSKISVASPPARLRIACLPPGCIEMYWVTSSTECPMITQQSVSSLCSATSAWLIVNLRQLGGLGGARPDVLCPIGSAPWTSLGPRKASPWAATAPGTLQNP